ncbi:MAG: HDIG domain-containing protein [Proteobacteria bacterium]|nr:HDIG domain-containing protein [Pseudomonadota bacterium]
MAERTFEGARRAFAAAAGEIGSFFSSLARARAFSWISIVLLAAAVTLVTTISFQQIPPAVSVGQIAARDIKADRNYEIVDEEAGKKLRDEAMASVLPVYDYDAGLAAAQEGRVREAFEAARRLVAGWAPPDRSAAARAGTVLPISDERRAEMERLLSQRLGIELPESAVSQLAKDGFNRRSEGAILTLVSRAMSGPVLTEAPQREGEEPVRAILRTVEEAKEAGAPPRKDEVEVEDICLYPVVFRVRAQIEKENLSALGIGDARTGAAIASLASAMVQPNVIFNRTESASRRDAAAAAIKDATIKLKAGEMIIREGARFDNWHLKVLSGMRAERKSASYYLEFMGTFLLVICFLLLPFMSVEKFFRRGRVSREDHLLMALVGLSVLLIMRFSLTLAPAVRDAMLLSLNSSGLHYAVPVAGGAMLIRMFLRADVSFVFAIVLSIFAGLFVETDATFVAYCLITSLTAIMAIANADRRSHIIRAGALTGAAGVAAVLGIRLILSANAPVAASLSETLWCMLFAMVSGVGCAIYAMIAAPVVESVSGYTSDIKLLELANLNHPVLRELVVRAPGTYHHSHLVGLLGEAAATEIGANALLVRVGAYYHDIGKLKKPLYFVENTKPGENRHEKLSPSMSALIVSAHVKDGIELAQSSKIPRAIYDMIPQHHGTRLISFFYEKAKVSEDPSLQRVDPKDFRYPGPKPQTREAAILMLADVTEASVRALKEKSPARIEQTVQKTIHDIFNETQLDECDLTLRDLNMIATAFTRTLLGIYHARIEYAKEVENEKDKQTHREAAGDHGEHPQRAPEGEGGPGGD